LHNDQTTNQATARARVHAEQIHALYRQGLLPMVVHMITTLTICSVLWDVTDHARLGLLFSSLSLVSIARLALIIQYRKRQPADAAVPIWGRLFFLTLLLSGVIWGVGGLLIMPADSVVHQLFLVFMILGMASGVAAGYSSHAGLVRILITVMLVPFSIWFPLPEVPHEY
jgi:hypothetical protein